MKAKMRVDLFRPCITAAEHAAAGHTLDSGWLGLGPRVAEFEAAWAKRVGHFWCVATNSCTAALEIVAERLRLRKGDEVIVPTLTFASTATAFDRAGATVVFADVDPQHLCMTSAQVAPLVTERTRVVVAVGFGGYPTPDPDDGNLASWVSRVEDAAHRGGGRAAPWSDYSCWSFQAIKNLTTGGDGGAITGHGNELYGARELRWCGIDKSTHERAARSESYRAEYDLKMVGTKAHMADLGAAIGLAQLEHLTAMQVRRDVIAAMYRAGLSGLGWLDDGVVRDVGLAPDAADHAWHLFWIRCGAVREQLRGWLAENGVTTGIHYKPLHLFSVFGRRAPCPVAEAAWSELLSLPMHPGLTDIEVEYVIDLIREFYQNRVN